MEYDYIKKLEGRHVLFTPLNWGLGHATRSIPLIRKALKHARGVTIASDGLALLTLQKVFPQLPVINLPAYNIEYTYESMVLNGITQYPKARSIIRKEKAYVSEIVEKSGIDLIISDNRFGCYNDRVESIFLTHQLTLQHPNRLIKALINFQNQKWLQQFNSIWVPDYENSKLSGKLSKHSRLEDIHFIGPQSIYKKEHREKDIDILIVISGPEPQRTILERKLLKLAVGWSGLKVVLVSGSTYDAALKTPKEIVYKKLTVGEELNDLFNRSRLLITRSGYSTLMDIDQLNIPHILIPTPGQTEQEYLAAYWEEKRLSGICSQKNIESKLPKMVESLLQ